jgi:hypothetical protein
MTKQPIITRLVDFCNSTINDNNILSEQENETLLVLMRKCISPSPDYCKAATEEEMDKCKVFVNSIDDGFGDEASNILAETCTTLATALGQMIAKNVAVLMKKEKVEEPPIEMLHEAMNEMYKTYGLPPDMLSKPVILGLFVFSTIEDPLVALLNASKCIDIGEKLSGDAIRISAQFVHEIMYP